MLILTRHVGEAIRVGDNVTVTIMGLKGDQVHLGIDAPKDLPVHREEVFQRLLKEGSLTLTRK